MAFGNHCSYLYYQYFQHFGIRYLLYQTDLSENFIRKIFEIQEKFYIEQHKAKQLITSLGTVDFEKTLFSDKKCRSDMFCIFDEILGLEQHQRITPDAVCNVLKEAAESLYRKGGSKVNPKDEISPTLSPDTLLTYSKQGKYHSVFAIITGI